jgi:phosphatidylserine decarboxylase
LALSEKLLISGLGVLPKNLMSRVAGQVAGIRLPQPLQQAQIRAFGSFFGVDFDEVKEPLSTFSSVQDFFIRELKDGARPVDATPDAVVSPCDGAWGQSGEVEAGQILQVKGRPYRVSRLLGDEELAERMEGGAFATLYLSPRDYHRFHTPFAGRMQAARYLPGHLWPVNRAGVNEVDSLFAVNERIVGVFEPEEGTGILAMVAVGATMVGKVKVTFDDLVTNRPGQGPEERDYGPEGLPFAKCQQWGHFEFGSTLVLVATPGLLQLDAQSPGTPLRLGTRIGTLHSALAGASKPGGPDEREQA